MHPRRAPYSNQPNQGAPAEVERGNNLLTKDGPEVTVEPGWRIDERDSGALAIDQLIKRPAIVHEYRPQSLMALGEQIKAQLERCKVEISENFQGERQMMLRNACLDELHEPCPTLRCRCGFDVQQRFRSILGR
jgi:hypothetical protein